MTLALVYLAGGYVIYGLIGMIVGYSTYRRLITEDPDMWPDVAFAGALEEGVLWPVAAWDAYRGRRHD